MHRATRLHYDFRLEMAGVLASWAIPKGFHYDPHERRLAMKTEDHPYDYRTFEGVIPEGNYGAGEVIVWDEGTYELAEGDDPVAAVEAGKIAFRLQGKKLRGEWALVRIRPREGERGEPWLLLKHREPGDDPTWTPEAHPESVTSGRTLADIAAGRGRVRTWNSDRAASPPTTRRAPRARDEPVPADVAPMLATLVEAPFDDPGWFFELKWDGFRAIATIDAEGGVRLVSRNGLDLLARFPELRALGGAFRSRPIVVDGEICVLDAEGRPSFQRLQTHGPKDEATFVAFDLLYADGRDQRAEPLRERKRRLEMLLVPGHGAMLSAHVVGEGRALFALAEQRGLEGIVGKQADAPYRSIRSREWVKIKAKRRQEFAIGGWTEPRGARDELGALLLGTYEGERFVYAGHVGTGFDAATLRALGERLRPLEQASCPFTTRPKTNTRAHWATPTLVCECAFTEWTRDGLLRHPVYLGLRPDKTAREVVRERPG